VQYAALAFFAAGCVYTDGINQKPIVRDIAPIETLTRWDKRVHLSVDAFDPDGDPFTLNFAFDGSLQRDGERDISFVPTGPGEYVITAIATDDSGASSSLERRIVVPDMTPQIGALIVQADASATADLHYPIETTFTLAIDDRQYLDDDATRSEDWHFLSRPAGSSATFDASHRFTADLAGNYHVEVTATDPYMHSASKDTMIVVNPDRPPCIAGTQPLATTELLVFDVGTRNQLAVTAVDDDLNPFPAGPHGAAIFRWSVKSPTDPSFVVLNGYTQPSYVLDGTSYAVGDRVEVRVEVSDITGIWPSGCGSAQRECPYLSGCEGWLTWEIEFR